MNDPVKNALESALLAALVFAVCLWLVLSSEDSGNIVHIAFGSIGMVVSVIAHLAYVGVALHRAGRSVWPWVVAMVLLPGMSVVAMVLLSSALPDKMADKIADKGQADEPPPAG